MGGDPAPAGAVPAPVPFYRLMPRWPEPYSGPRGDAPPPATRHLRALPPRGPAQA